MKEENKLSQPYADEEVSHLPQIKKEKEKKEQELTTRLKNNLVDLKKKKKGQLSGVQEHKISDLRKQ